MLAALKYTAIVVGIAIAVAAIEIGYTQYTTLQNRVVTVEAQLTTTREELLGYSKYTDYIAKGKQSLQGDAHLLTTTLNENVKWVEHIERKVLFFTSTGTVLLNLNIEYAFGVGMIAEHLVIAGEAQNISKPQGVGAQNIGLHGQAVSVATDHLVIRLQTDLFGNQGPGPTCHPHHGCLVVRGVDHVHHADKGLGFLFDVFHICAAGRAQLTGKCEVSGF